MAINLKQDEYLSDFISSIPTSNGVHLIESPTGSGKTFLMNKMANGNHKHFIVPPYKSIVEQQTQICIRDDIDVAITQLEHLLKHDVESLEGCTIHIDECQHLYQSSGFREAYYELYRLIQRVRHHARVLCYSATYRHEFSPVVFDSVTSVSKMVKEKELIVCMKLPKKKHTYQGVAINEIIEWLKHDLSKPILMFINNRKKLYRVRDEIIKAGLSCLAVDREVVQEAKQDANHPLNALMKDEMISNVGYQVVLSTCVLSEGINIKSPVRIISTGGTAESITQEFGRCRNPDKGTYELICAGGVYKVNIDECIKIATKISKTIDELNGKHTFDIQRTLQSYNMDLEKVWHLPHEFRVKALAWAIYGSNSMKPRYASSIVTQLKNHGYAESTSSFEFQEVNATLLEQIKKHDRIKLCKAFIQSHDYLVVASAIQKQHGFSDEFMKLTLDHIMKTQEVFEQMKIKGNDFMQAYEELALVDFVFMSGLAPQHVEFINDFMERDKCVDAKERITSDELKKRAYQAWHSKGVFKGAESWFTLNDADGYEESGNEYVLTQSQFRLYKYLLGWQLGDNRNGYYRENPDVFQWDVSLTNKQGNKFRTREKHIKSDISVFCNKHKVNKLDIANMSVKEIKALNEVCTVYW